MLLAVVIDPTTGVLRFVVVECSSIKASMLLAVVIDPTTHILRFVVVE